MVTSSRSLGDAEGVAPSLEVATQLGRLGRQISGGWQLGVCVAAGEAGGSFRSARPPQRGPWVPPGQAADPERSAAENNRRRRREMRRYCAANGLNRLGTLTYAGDGVREWAEVVEHIALFFRELRRLVGQRFAYAWVIQWHPGGHGLHVHFAVGRFIRRSMVEAAWPHGFVHIKLLGDLPVGSGVRDEARKAGRYLASYIGSDLHGERPQRRHAFDVAQGFKPVIERLEGRSFEEVRALAADLMGAWPTFEWRSDDDPTWDRPSSCFLSW